MSSFLNFLWTIAALIGTAGPVVAATSLDEVLQLELQEYDDPTQTVSDAKALLSTLQLHTQTQLWIRAWSLTITENAKEEDIKQRFIINNVLVVGVWPDLPGNIRCRGYRITADRLSGKLFVHRCRNLRE